MQIFKAFYKSVFKRANSLLIYTGIFILILVFMAALLPEQNASYEASRIEIAVFDHDQSPASQGLYHYLERTQKIVDIPEDHETITDELFYRNIKYVLIIPEGFHSDFTGLENIQQPGSTYGSLLDSQIEQYVKILDTYRTAGFELQETVIRTDNAMNSTVEVTMEQNAGGSQKPLIYYFFLYQPYIFIAIMVSSLGGILLIFRNKNLNARIQCSSFSITKRNIYLSLCSILYSILIWLLFIVLGTIMYGKALWNVQGMLFMLNSLVIMMFSISLTFLISFFAKNDTILDMFANVAGLGLSFLSGIFVPLEMLSGSVQKFAHFLPSYWYVKNCDLLNGYAPGMPLNRYFSYLGIQLLFMASFFAIAMAVSKLKKTA